LMILGWVARVCSVIAKYILKSGLSKRAKTCGNW
jgi:hypothetical protein